MVQIDNLTEITTVLADDGLILYPTDTLWAIGCDACNAFAVERVYKLKNIDPSHKFILLADSIEMVKTYVHQVHPRIDTLLQYHTRPLSVVYDGAKNLPSSLISPDGSIAFRVVQDAFCSAIIQQLGRPIVATTASIGQEDIPQNFGGISSAVIEGVDYVVRTKRIAQKDAQPSVIIRLSDKKELIFIRE
jgi:L-threonylcarbamoyladenylate synthase